MKKETGDRKRRPGGGTGATRPPASRAPNSNLRQRPAALQEEMARRLIEGDCTQAGLSVWLAAEHGIRAGQPRISAWFRWYTAKRDDEFWRQAIRRRLEAGGGRNPKLAEEELFLAGQRVFAERALKRVDFARWVETQRMTLRRRSLRLREAGAARERERAGDFTGKITGGKGGYP